MGSILGKSMEENFKKQQEFMLMTGQMQVSWKDNYHHFVFEFIMVISQIHAPKISFVWH